MTNAGRKATVALVAAVAMMVAGRANAQDEPTAAPGPRDATIVLHVVNYAALSRDVLDVAMARVARVYKRIGVPHRVGRWRGEVPSNARTAGSISPSCCSRATWPKRKSQRHGIKDGVLGQAHVPSGRASIFCDRIAAMPGAPKYFAIPLGDIIAHEVGHLLLGANSHPAAASCVRTWTCTPFSSRVLTRRRPASIRTTLMELTAATTGR